MSLAAPRRHLTDEDLGQVVVSSVGVTARTSLSEVDVRPVNPVSLESRFQAKAQESRARALDWARESIEPLRQLPGNWDSYGALPVHDVAAEITIGIAAGLAFAAVPSPQVFPTADGGLSLEWHRPNFDFVITVPPPEDGQPSAYLFSPDDEWTIPDLQTPDPRFASAIAALQAG